MTAVRTMQRRRRKKRRGKEREGTQDPTGETDRARPRCPLLPASL